MSFRIKNIIIPGRMILAPMDGYTSEPFRLFARKFGSAASYSEFIGAIEVAQKHPGLPEKIHFAESERPFAYQVFDNHPARIFQAAEELRKRNPDFIDLNLGCSAKHVSARGAGAGLLKEPEKITLILETLVKGLDIPVTAKMRLGWDDSSLNYLDVARRIEQAGCSALAVHARTRKQGYSGEANWNAIAEIKEAVSIPVIGNGDIRRVADIDQMISQTGCDAVMIGRAALSNPWIFSRLDREQINPQTMIQDAMDLFDLMQGFYGVERGIILNRKFLARFLAPYDLDPLIRQKLMTSISKEEIHQQLECALMNS